MGIHNPVDDLDIQALVDNQLSKDEAKRVRLVMANAPHLAKRYRELQQQKELLQAWWQEQLRSGSTDFGSSEEGAGEEEDGEDEPAQTSTGCRSCWRNNSTPRNDGFGNTR